MKKNKRNKIKIRYVNQGGIWLMQKKGWFGWYYLCYILDLGHGSITHFYTAETTTELLDKVLKDHFNTSKEFVSITQYPTIYKY